MKDLAQPPHKYVMCKLTHSGWNGGVVPGTLYLYRVSTQHPRFCIMTVEGHRHIVALTLDEMRLHFTPVKNMDPVPANVSFREALRLYPA